MNMHRTTRGERDHFDLRRFLYRIEAGRLLSYERSLASSFDLVTFTSAIDSQYVFGAGEQDPDRFLVISNGCDLPGSMPPPQSRRKRHEIAFVGNLHSLQNFDAAWFFARKVLPRLREKYPHVCLRLIGAIRPLARHRLSAIPGVRIEGVVPHLDTALSTARIGVCPVRVGSGIKNKVLDYFANRLAVVSTSHGVEGLAARANEHLLIADTADEWFEQVSRLLEDDLTAQRLADAGRELARTQYQWDACVKPLVDRINAKFMQTVATIEPQEVLEEQSLTA